MAKFSTKRQVYSVKNIFGHLALEGKLYLFRNVFTQGKVGIADGKVAVGCKTKYLFIYIF